MNSNKLTVATAAIALLAAVLSIVAVSRSGHAGLLDAARYQGVGVGNNNLQIFVVDTERGLVKSCTIGNPQQGTAPNCTPWSDG
jgi:hypothetical protein